MPSEAEPTLGGVTLEQIVGANEKLDTIERHINKTTAALFEAGALLAKCQMQVTHDLKKEIAAYFEKYSQF